MPGITVSKIPIPFNHGVPLVVTYRDVISGDIIYRRRRQNGKLYIDYSDDGGTTWELDIDHFLLSEDVIEVTIDDSPAGYRDVVRDGVYCIDVLIDGGTGDWDTEGTDWENIIKIDGREWIPDIELGGETPAYWYKEGTRSELTLPNAISPGTGDKTILLPYVYMNNSEYCYVNDNGVMDIVNNLGQVGGAGDSGCTICATINAELLTKVAYKNFINKWVAASVVGRWAIYAASTTGYLSASCQSSGGTVAVNSTVDITTLTFPFLAFIINDTEKKIHFYINNVQIGTGVSYTGTFEQMANAYRTYINAVNTVTTGAPTGTTGQSCAGFAIYPFILSSDQLTTKYNRGFVAGATFDYTCNDIVLYNSGSVAGSNMAMGYTGSRTINIKYGINGSRRLLEVGYTKFTSYTDKEIHVAYRDVNTPKLSSLSGYTKDSDNPGISTGHNGCDSYVDFGVIDRSDVDLCYPLATLTSYQYYYDVNLKTGLNITETTNFRISNFFKSIKYFSKRNLNVITDILIYTTGKTGSDYNKIIAWTGEDLEPVFGSGAFMSIGMDSIYNETATHLHIGKALVKEGPFVPAGSIKYTGAPNPRIGNPKLLPLNINKCNGTTPVAVGEINWLLTYEMAGESMYLAKSYNGLVWEYVTQFPAGPSGGLGQCDFFIDNDDPSDYHNIHVLSFNPLSGGIYETHPLSADFTLWSDQVLIFDTGVVQTYNATVILISGVYHMFYSIYLDANHYMYHAICTHDPFTASNDWHNVNTGDWSGLGHTESYSMINFGGSNWILYYLQLYVTPLVYKYSISTDDGATWSAGVTIPSLSSPLQYSAGIIKLK